MLGERAQGNALYFPLGFSVHLTLASQKALQGSEEEENINSWRKRKKRGNFRRNADELCQGGRGPSKGYGKEKAGLEPNLSGHSSWPLASSVTQWVSGACLDGLAPNLERCLRDQMPATALTTQEEGDGGWGGGEPYVPAQKPPQAPASTGTARCR